MVSFRHRDPVNKTTAGLHQAAVIDRWRSFLLPPHLRKSHPPELPSRRRHRGVSIARLPRPALAGQPLTLGALTSLSWKEVRATLPNANASRSRSSGLCQIKKLALDKPLSEWAT